MVAIHGAVMAGDGGDDSAPAAAVAETAVNFLTALGQTNSFDMTRMMFVESDKSGASLERLGLVLHFVGRFPCRCACGFCLL